MFFSDHKFFFNFIIITSFMVGNVQPMLRLCATPLRSGKAHLVRKRPFHAARQPIGIACNITGLSQKFSTLSLNPSIAVTAPTRLFTSTIDQKKEQKTNLDLFNESWLGENYEKNSNLQFDIGLDVFKKYYVPYVKPNAVVLDAGCGTGRITRKIAEHVPQGIVIGIDQAADMIATAQQQCNPDDDRLIFKQMDVCDISYKEAFDHAISLSCLHWVKDIKKAFKSVAGSLKPGGTFLILMEPKNDFPLIKALEEIFGKYNIEIPWYMHTQQDLFTWLKEAGFSMVGSQDYYHDVTFKHPTELADWLSGMPFAPHLSQEEQTKIMGEVVKRYVHYESLGADDSLKLTLPEIVIFARK